MNTTQNNNTLRRRLIRFAADHKVSVALISASVVAVVAIAAMKKPGNALSSDKAPPVQVRVEVVRPIPEFLDTIELPGVVEPNIVVNVAAEVDARIEAIPATEGEVIKQGDKILQLNTEMLQAEFDQAKAQADFDQRDYDRVKEARQRGVVTTSEEDQARTKSAASLAAFNAVAARLERAEIFAPISGILDNIPVEPGEYVKPGTVVAQIVDMDTVKVVVQVPERVVGHLRLGQKETISAENAEVREFNGSITYIGELADEQTRTTRVEISVPNPKDPNGARRLRSGQIVRVKLVRGIIKNAIMVPLDTVLPSSEGSETTYESYVVVDGKAQQRNVTLGILKGYRVQIKEGLQDGDVLIVSGQTYVGPGQDVSIVTDESETKPSDGESS